VGAEHSRYQWGNPLWCVMIARVLHILDEELMAFPSFPIHPARIYKERYKKSLNQMAHFIIYV
jgi:hypothetical protein